MIKVFVEHGITLKKLVTEFINKMLEIFLLDFKMEKLDFSKYAIAKTCKNIYEVLVKRKHE